MEYVILVDRSAGNESVGEMWTETKVFPETATLADVTDWVRERTHNNILDDKMFNSNVRITVSQ